MVGFYKFMVISACLFLATIIFFAGQKSYRENRADRFVWLVFDAYAIGLIYTVIKILWGG